MKKGLIGVSIVLIVMSIYVMVESSRFERTMKMGIGIGFLPFWMSAIIGFLALLLLINIFRGRITFEDKPVFPKENFFRMVSMVIALILYLISIDIIGYMISTFLFLFATIFILQRSRLIYVLFSAAVFTSILYGIFKLWLKSPLPTGLLGI